MNTMQRTSPAVKPAIKRRGGRCYTDRCESCGYQVKRGARCGRCTVAETTASSKPRVSAKLFSAALNLKAARPDVADGRLERAVVLATDLNQIDPTYRATVCSCHCPDATFKGRNRGSLSVCKHSLAIRLVRMVAA